MNGLQHGSAGRSAGKCIVSAGAPFALGAVMALTAPFSLALADTAATENGGSAVTTHGMAMHGEVKYGPDFTHLDYVNPDAPRGGTARLSAFGSYDSLHPFIIRGQSAAGLGLIYESLTTSTSDEAFSQYGLIAQSMTVPDDRSWVSFTLNPDARWHDGEPITVDDVIWTFNTLQEDGVPFYQSYYGDVSNVTATDDRTVRFDFGRSDNAELPLILGQMIVLPKHYWEDRDFTRTTLEPPLGSGPYRIANVDTGRAITYERVDDWWAQDLPIMRGQYNFDTIRYDYYRDDAVMLEAFLAGRYDFRQENTAANWATAYDIEAVRDGRVILEELPTEDPRGMQAFVMNTRRDIFRDPRVREAINYLFDFEFLNRTIFHGAYERSNSYFSNSELAATGEPSEAELALLEPFRGQIPDQVFEQPFEAPTTDGSGRSRDNVRHALALLEEAGWVLRDGTLVNAETGRPFRFELLLVQSNLDRVANPFARNLERAGIDMTVRIVDTSQYTSRIDSFDFDMVSTTFRQSLSPGNEQRDFWGSGTADQPGSRNLIGVADPVVDALIDTIIAAEDREALITATRALDRVLLWNWYVVPHWHSDTYRIAYWNKFERPENPPRYGLPFVSTWWANEDAR